MELILNGKKLFFPVQCFPVLTEGVVSALDLKYWSVDWFRVTVLTTPQAVIYDFVLLFLASFCIQL